MISIKNLAILDKWRRDFPGIPAGTAITMALLSDNLERIWNQIEPFDTEVEMVPGPDGRFTAADFRAGFRRLEGLVVNAANKLLDIVTFKERRQEARQGAVDAVKNWGAAMDSASDAMIGKLDRLTSIPTARVGEIRRELSALAESTGNYIEQTSKSVLRIGFTGLGFLALAALVWILAGRPGFE